MNQNSTIIFPLPLDVIRPFLESTGGGAAAAEKRPAAAEEPALEVPNGREALPAEAPNGREALAAAAPAAGAGRFAPAREAAPAPRDDED